MDLVMSNIKVFGEMSSEYLKYRPDYPEALFQYLANISKHHKLVWDVGTGNGQAAFQLSNYFDKVIATDINQNQLTVAPQKINISYQVGPSEKTSLLSHSVDLITCAQSMHWFDLEKFYEEVRRVSKPEAYIAAWSYHLPLISTEIDKCVKKLHNEILHDFWPAERRFVDERYQTLPFPFKREQTPMFSIKKTYQLDQFLGYLGSWYAVKEYHKSKQKNPLELIYDDLKSAWNNQNEYIITWPIYMLLGKCYD